jgi:hypothetical protein
MPVHQARGQRRLRGLVLAAAVVFPLLAGCDFTVSNPGPIQDPSLNDPLAHDALVTGSEKMLSLALTRLGRHVGAVTKEITASGLVGGGNLGTPERIRQGILNDEETDVHWNEAQQARWIAEGALTRIQETLPGGATEAAKNLQFARANLYAGYANRLLGENMCQSVFDGGAAGDSRLYFTRAETQLTAAASVAAALTPRNTQLEQAAYAARASVRASLGDWAGVVADAARVPANFVFTALFSNISPDQYNAFAFANLNTPHRSDSVVRTFYEQYFTDTKDPRTPWTSNPAFPFGGPAPEGQVRWLPPQKYTRNDQPMNLSSGREMRLLEAEAKLIAGDVTGAMTQINALRTAVSVAPWPATTDATQAWTNLKRERGIELWLEARRLGDLRRWAAANRPGVVEDMTGRSMCFPVGRRERDSNPNI